jgi:hypothetical protein
MPAMPASRLSVQLISRKAKASVSVGQNPSVSIGRPSREVIMKLGLLDHFHLVRRRMNILTLDTSTCLINIPVVIGV